MKRLVFPLLLILSFLNVSCHFFETVTNPEDNTKISLSRNELKLDIGAMASLDLNYINNPKPSASIVWEYDPSVIYVRSDDYGAVIIALKPGTTTLYARYSSTVTARCIVTVTSDSYIPSVTNPYVYSSAEYINLDVGTNTKVSASLFGGTNADINGYSWSIDKPSVASLSVEGNYCWITGESAGIAKITVRHTKAVYGYSFLVNVNDAGLNIPYLTTSDNVVRINLSDDITKDVEINLINSNINDYSLFTFSITDSSGNILADPPASVSSVNSNMCTITGLYPGSCYLHCHHPQASYDLNILVRVTKDADLSYIEPSETFVTISGDETKSVSLDILNYDKPVDSNLFSWSFSENASDCINYQLYNGNGINSGNEISFTGIASGTVTIEVNYPDVQSRKIIVFVRNIVSEASSVTTYITTSQNYIKLKKGSSIAVSIILNECTSGDINDLRWGIVNTASDGTSSSVIEWKEGAGTSTASSSRAASLSYSEQAYCIIQGVNSGTAYIDITHPKAVYPTRINFTVYEEPVVTENVYLSASSNSVIYIANGESSTLNVSGSSDISLSDISWALSSGSLCSILPEANVCLITAPVSGTGKTENTVTASHPLCSYSVSFTVITYDDINELNDINYVSISSDSGFYHKINLKESFDIVINSSLETDLSQLSFSTISGNSNIYFESSGVNCIKVYPLKTGSATICVSYPSAEPLYFVCDIYDDEIISSSDSVYLSTTSNVLYFDSADSSKELDILLNNVYSSSYNDIVYTLSSSDFEISYSQNKVTVTCLNDNSSGTLTISHPKSENVLTIYLKSGEKYQYVNSDYCFISCDTDTLLLNLSDDYKTIVSKLNHTEINEQPVVSGFTYSCSATDIIEFNYGEPSCYCNIYPVNAGRAVITIRHPDSDMDKEVLVIVTDDTESSGIPYLTTEQNVITVVEGDFISLSASLINSSNIDSSCWKWNVPHQFSSLLNLTANNGSTALFSVLKPGTAEITVSHSECGQSLKFIIVILDKDSVTNRPYISSSQNIITLKKGDSVSVTASLIGGNNSDLSYFNWNVSDTTVALLNPVSDSCYIKALNTGVCYVTIKNSHYTDAYAKTVLVIVEDTLVDGFYISCDNTMLKLKPDDTELTLITASITGGDDTDGQNLIWWADDYNLVSISSVADTCSVIPLGKSGSTKIHVKHEKAAKVCDILVLISNYENFGFSDTTASITSGKLCFYPLQVPSVDENFHIEYESQNEDVCFIDGSNYVAYLAGINSGTTTVYARMVSSDNTLIASAEMLVSVRVQTELIPQISVGSSIINLEEGDSTTVSAVISGKNISEGEKYNLVWKLKSGNPAGISFFDGINNEFIGPDCQINALIGGEAEDGEYIINVSHPQTDTTTDIYVIVNKKGDLDISLNTDYITVYRDDGSFTITAEIKNGSSSDYNKIEWSNLRSGGEYIVTTSKSRGKTCTVTPKKEGTTTVFAKLPNGKLAKCYVTVKSSSEIILDTGAVHVIPGYTEVISYSTNPENASVLWYSENSNNISSLSENDSYFSYSVDTIQKKIYITGLKEYQGGIAGSISGVMTSSSCSSSPRLNVYVEYSLEVNCYDDTGSYVVELKNNSAASSSVKTVEVHYYPSNLCIELESDNDIMDITEGPAVSFEEAGLKKMKKTYSFIPKTEGSAVITVTGYLPSDPEKLYAAASSFNYSCFYDNYDIVPHFSSSAGAFTEYKDNKLYLSDGEEAVFYLEVCNENALCNIESVSFSPAQNFTANIEISKDVSGSSDKEHFYKIRTTDKDNTNDRDDYISDEEFYILDENIYLHKDGVDYPLIVDNASTQAKVKWGYKYYEKDTKNIANNGYDAFGVIVAYAELPDKSITNLYTLNKYQDETKNDVMINLLDNISNPYNIIDNYTFNNGNIKILEGGMHWFTKGSDYPNDDNLLLPISFNYKSATQINPYGTIYIYQESTFTSEKISTIDDFRKLSIIKNIPTNDNKDYYSVLLDWTDFATYSENTSVVIKKTTPYVITKKEYEDNGLLYFPSGIIIKSTRDYGLGWNNLKETTMSFKSDNIYASASKTSSKSSLSVPVLAGQIVIKYHDRAGNMVSNINNTIDVYYDRRPCEAYTNGNWKEITLSDGNKRWLLQ